MIFFFFVARRHSKEEQGSGAGGASHTHWHLTFPFAQGQPALPYHHHHLCFFPHNDYPGKSSFFSAPWLSRTITSSLSSSSPVSSLSSSYRFSFFVFNINKKTWFDFPFFWRQFKGNRSCLCPGNVHPFVLYQSFYSKIINNNIQPSIDYCLDSWQAIAKPQLTIDQRLTIGINWNKFWLVSR